MYSRRDASEPALLDYLVIHVGNIEQQHVSKRMLLLVLTMGLEPNLLSKDQLGSSLLRSLAERLPLLRRVGANQVDTFRVLVVEGSDGVSVLNTDYFSSEICGDGFRAIYQQGQKKRLSCGNRTPAEHSCINLGETQKQIR